MARNVWFAVVGRCAAVSVHEHADATEMVHEMRWLRGRWSGLHSSALGRDGLDVSVGGALWSLEEGFWRSRDRQNADSMRGPRGPRTVKPLLLLLLCGREEMPAKKGERKAVTGGDREEIPAIHGKKREITPAAARLVRNSRLSLNRKRGDRCVPERVCKRESGGTESRERATDFK